MKMYHIQSHTKKMMLLGAMMFLIGFTLYFHYANENVIDALVDKRAKAVGQEIDHLCNVMDYLVEQDGTWNAEKYRNVLTIYTESLDAATNVYAELMDEHFTTLSQRIITEDDKWRFEPRQYPDLMKRLAEENDGHMTVALLNTNSRTDVHLHWRWIPTKNEYANRVLLVIGVTQYSVPVHLLNRFVFGTVGLLLVAAVIIVWAMMMLSVERRRQCLVPNNLCCSDGSMCSAVGSMYRSQARMKDE